MQLMGECRYTLTMSCYARIEPLIIFVDMLFVNIKTIL